MREVKDLGEADAAFADCPLSRKLLKWCKEALRLKRRWDELSDNEYDGNASRLERRLDALLLPSGMRQQIDLQRPRLAAAETDDVQVRRAIAESFVEGYRAVLGTAVGLALASSLSAALLIGPEKRAP